ncbi:MAG TPA: hypothetical protein PK402_03515 [Tepidisphaeraceae bacterium]|nr:hypothetical protein [Tepidisphaeraceae bacterium]
MSVTTKSNLPDEPDEARQLPRSRVLAPRTSLVRRLKRLVVPERPREAVGNFIIVALLTIMIWIWAFNEQIAPSTPIIQQVELRSENPSRFVRLVNPGQTSVEFNIRGQKSIVDRVRSIVARGNSGKLVLTVPSNLEPGQRSLPVTDLLRGPSLFTENGLTVLTTSPIQVEVMIDDIITRQIEIKAPNTLTGFRSVVFTPSTVVARGPRSSIERVTSAVADFSSFEQIKRPTVGQDLTLESVPLTAPDVDNVEWETPIVKSVTLTPSDLTETSTTIPSMVVYVTYPASLRPRVQITPLTVANISIRGPASVIAQIQDEKLDPADRPKAVLEITREDVDRGGQGTRRVRIILPPGVSLVGDAPEVRFEVLPAVVEPG